MSGLYRYPYTADDAIQMQFSFEPLLSALELEEDTEDVVTDLREVVRLTNEYVDRVEALTSDLYVVCHWYDKWQDADCAEDTFRSVLAEYRRKKGRQ